MPVPWLRLVSAALGITEFAMTRRAGNRPSQDEEKGLAGGSRALGSLEAQLAGVVVAALKEAFERDSRRLDFERQQAEAERQRAERALRLELVRQAGERELARLRLVVGAALVGWIGTMFLSARLIGGPTGARILLGAGWVLLLGALATAFAGQSSIGKTLARLDLAADTVHFSRASALASWLIVAGLALIGLAILVG